jgi:hypothetical protein
VTGFGVDTAARKGIYLSRDSQGDLSQRERTTNMSDWVYDMGADDLRDIEQLCPVCEDDMGQTLCGGCEAEGWRRCPCCEEWRKGPLQTGTWACGCKDDEPLCEVCRQQYDGEECGPCSRRVTRDYPECDPYPRREEVLS